MTQTRTRDPVEDPGERWLSVIPAVIVGGAFFALWFWLLPGWLGFHVETAGAARWRWLAALPSILGFAVAIRCVWNFGWTGRGTRRTARGLKLSKGQSA